MKRILWTLTVGLLVAVTPAFGLDPIVTHLDDNNPATEGFSAGGLGWTVVGPIDDGGTLAWSYTQPGIVGEERQYRYDLDAADQTAIAGGWVATARLRVVDRDVPLGGIALIDLFNFANAATPTSNHRYQVRFGSDADGNMVVARFDDTGFPIIATLPGDSIYHTIQMIDDNGDGIASIFADDVLISSDWAGTFAGGERNQFKFGSGSADDVAQINWTIARLDPIPEPTTLSLLAMSVLMVGRRRR